MGVITRFVDKTVLVPLTGSLYVPGKLRDVENVIVDVGTGYYVQKVRIMRYDRAYADFYNGRRGHKR